MFVCFALVFWISKNKNNALSLNYHINIYKQKVCEPWPSWMKKMMHKKKYIYIYTLLRINTKGDKTADSVTTAHDKTPQWAIVLLHSHSDHSDKREKVKQLHSRLHCCGNPSASTCCSVRPYDSQWHLLTHAQAHQGVPLFREVLTLFITS